MTMSRRDSRVNIAVRQTDALQEFETFKKKFLLANKQITKQNSNLSLKIEELNAHISTLYVENLRLRASEIALASQLRREKERSQKIMADAEAATLRLLEQLGAIRHSYKIPPVQTITPESPPSPPPPKIQRPVRSPSALRLAQLPSVPGIVEDAEPQDSSCDESSHCTRHSQAKADSKSDHAANGSAFNMKTKARNSASRLPVPSRVSSPPPVVVGTFQHVDFAAEGSLGMSKKKLMRRRSGLMTFNGAEPCVRPPTPSFGAPATESEEVEDSDEGDKQGGPVYTESEKEVETKRENSEAEELKKRRREKRSKARSSESDGTVEDDAKIDRSKEKKRAKEREAVLANRLKDVTNSPRRKRSGSTTDSASEVDHLRATENKTASHKPPSQPSPLSIPANIVPEPEAASYLPTPLPSSEAESSSANGGVRERRTRKSVNYAEPKLNTKMRKPDSIPPPGARPSLVPFAQESTTQEGSGVPRRRSLESSSQESSSTGSAKALQDDQSNIPSSRVSSSRAASSTAKRKIQLTEQLLSCDSGLSDDASELSDIDDGFSDDGGGDADSEYAPSAKRSWSNVGVSRRRSAALSGGGSSVKLGSEGVAGVGEKRRKSAVA